MICIVKNGLKITNPKTPLTLKELSGIFASPTPILPNYCLLATLGECKFALTITIRAVISPYPIKDLDDVPKNKDSSLLLNPLDLTYIPIF